MGKCLEHCGFILLRSEAFRPWNVAVYVSPALLAERLDQAKVRTMETVLLPPGKFPSPGETESDGKGPKMDNYYLEIGLSFFEIKDFFLSDGDNCDL